MQQKYSFVTRWEIKAPIEKVWNTIYDSVNWPVWWKGVLSVQVLEKGEPNGVNGVRRYIWKSALPYKLSFDMRLTEREDLKQLHGVAFGELEGEGTWLFEQNGDRCRVQYNWNVLPINSG